MLHYCNYEHPKIIVKIKINLGIENKLSFFVDDTLGLETLFDPLFIPKKQTNIPTQNNTCM